MVLSEFQPSPRLTEYVRVYRIVQFMFDHPEKIPFKPYPPKPEHCLSFYPRDTEKVQYADSGKWHTNLKSVLFGQQQEVTNRYVGKDFLVFQVVFRPGALYRLTGIPSHEITNQYLDAETIFPANIKEVNEQLFHAPDFKTMIQVVEKFLTQAEAKQQKEAHRLDQVSNQVLTTKENVSVDWMAKVSYLSNRQLERKFLDRMGVTPKYFSRLVRFENAFRMKNQFPEKDWLSIAIHCGYHDYQHLVKEYQEFTGKTPTEFHQLDLGAPERQFGEADTY